MMETYLLLILAAPQDAVVSARDVVRAADTATQKANVTTYDAHWAPFGKGFDSHPTFVGRVTLAGKSKQRSDWRIMLQGMLQSPHEPPAEVHIADNGTEITQTTADMYRRSQGASSGSFTVDRLCGAWIPEFVIPRPFADEIEAQTLRYEGIQTVKTVPCHVVYVEYKDSGRSRWYFGADDYLPRRVERLYNDLGNADSGLALTIENLHIVTRMQYDDELLVKAVPTRSFRIPQPAKLAVEKHAAYCVSQTSLEDRRRILRAPNTGAVSNLGPVRFNDDRLVRANAQALNHRVGRILAVPGFGDLLADLKSSQGDHAKLMAAWRRHDAKLVKKARWLLEPLIQDDTLTTQSYGKEDRKDDGFYIEANAKRAEIASLIFFSRHTRVRPRTAVEALLRIKTTERDFATYPSIRRTSNRTAKAVLKALSSNITASSPSVTMGSCFTVKDAFLYFDKDVNFVARDRFDEEGTLTADYYCDYLSLKGVDRYYPIIDSLGRFVAVVMVTWCEVDDAQLTVREGQGSTKSRAEGR